MIGSSGATDGGGFEGPAPDAARVDEDFFLEDTDGDVLEGTVVGEEDEDLAAMEDFLEGIEGELLEVFGGNTGIAGHDFADVELVELLNDFE